MKWVTADFSEVLRDARLLRVRQTRNAVPAPADFTDFWQRTAGELSEIDPAPRARKQDAGSPSVVCGEFDSWAGAKIGCWFSPRAHKDVAQERVLIVTGHGYGSESDPERVRRLSRLGFDVVAVDVRAFGLSRDAVSGLSPGGYLLTGAHSSEACILRGAVCDYLQAYCAACKWFGTPLAATFQGFSFAGGLATMAAGVLSMGRECGLGFPRAPGVVALGAPTFGDLDRRLRLCQSGSGKELIEHLQTYPERRRETLDVFRYYDACYFAPFVGEGEGKTRVVAGVGLDDPVVPAETVFSIYNALSRPPELYEFPCSHTERKEEQEWVRWETAWVRASQELLLDPPVLLEPPESLK